MSPTAREALLLTVGETLCGESLSDTDDARVQREVLRVVVAAVRVAEVGGVALPLGKGLQLALLRALLQLHAHTGRTGGDGGASLGELGELRSAGTEAVTAAASLLEQIDATITALAGVSIGAEERSAGGVSILDALFGAHIDSLLPVSMEGHAAWTNGEVRSSFLLFAHLFFCLLILSFDSRGGTSSNRCCATAARSPPPPRSDSVR